jgi:hypothetical protein
MMIADSSGNHWEFDTLNGQQPFTSSQIWLVCFCTHGLPVNAGAAGDEPKP